MKKAIVPLGIILLVVFGVFMYLNRFTIFHVSDVDGYVFDTNNIAANLSAGMTENSEKVTFANIKVSDTIYQSGKKHYIGEESKKNVNLDYPIIAKDTSSVYVLNDNGKYIDENFIKETTYKNSVFTEGYMYNGTNLQRTSEDKYYFLELNNGIFVNLVELKLKTGGKEIVIPVNSFIYFEQSFLRYYTLEAGKYYFYEVPNILDKNKIYVGEEEYVYYDLLIFLEVITAKVDIIEIEEEIELEPERPPVVITPSETTPSQGLVGGETPSGGHIVEEEYVKPVVTFDKAKIGVYSFNGELEIYDPTNRIYKTPTFEYRYKGNVFLRNSFPKAGHIETIGLMPSTTYEVTAYYYYHDEFSNKMKNTFYEGEFTTKGISELETFKMSIGGTTPDINNVTINNIQISNKKTDEVLKGLKSGIVKIGNAQLKLNSGDISDIVNLKRFDYKTDNILDSNTTYSGDIKLYDLANNEMKITGNTFSFTTLKSPPKATLTTSLSKNFTVADLRIDISNKDEMADANYYFRVFDSNGVELEYADHSREKTNILGDVGLHQVQLTNLYAQSTYRVFVYADYTNVDGKRVTEYVMASDEFITYDVSMLGSIDFTVNVPEITQTYARLEFKYTKYNETNPVFSLIDNNIMLRIYDANEIDPTGKDKEQGLKYSQPIRKSDMILGIEVRLGEGFTENFRIDPAATYMIDLVPQVTSGGKSYEVARTLSTIYFETLKDDATVYIKNGFISDGYLDFDVCIEDPNGAIKEDAGYIKLYIDEEHAVGVDKEVKKRPSCTPLEGESDSDVYTRIQYKGLENKKYELVAEALNYNIGNSDKTLKANFKMRSETVEINGTTGDMTLNNLVNMVNYKTTVYENGSLTEDIKGVNLFDIGNNTRWKSTGGSLTSDLKEIRIEDEEVVLEAYKGWRMYSYYLPELANRDFVLSFEYEYEEGTAITNATEQDKRICISFDDNSSRCDIKLGNLVSAKDNTRHSFAVDPTKYDIGEYISFYIWESADKSLHTKLTLKNVKLEIGTDGTATGYTSFGEKNPGDEYTPAYAGTFHAEFTNIITDRVAINVDDELYFNDATYEYLIRYFKNGEEVDTLQRKIEFTPYDEITGQLVRSIADDYTLLDVEADVDFQAILSIRTVINNGTEEGVDRYYDLKTVEFTTEAETRTIDSINDFLNMHMYGYYLVATDLNFTTTNSAYTDTFQGSIDFQGHKVTMSLKDGPTYLFNRIGGGGVVKNIDIHYILNNPKSVSSYYGLVYENYGLISNARFVVDSSVEPVREKSYTEIIDDTVVPPITKTTYYNEKTGHEHFGLFGEDNYGTIENIIIQLNEPIYCRERCTAGVIYNHGTIKNGYVTGVNIKAGYTADGRSKTVGAIAVTSDTNSKIENFYSLIDVELGSGIDTTKSTEYDVGNIVYSASGAAISNVIVVDPRIVHTGKTNYLYNTTYRDHNRDVNFSSVSTSSMIENVYYIGNFSYNNTKSEDGTISHLSNGAFLEARLNSEQQFSINWSKGVFPQLIWPEYMPTQETISIPKKNPSNYLKVLSVDKVIQDKESHEFGLEYTSVQNSEEIIKELKETYFAKVQLSIYNPRSYKIAGFKIDGIGSSAVADEILVASQAIGGDDGIDVINVYIKSPEIFRTKYTVQDIYLNKQNQDNKVDQYTMSCANGGITVETDCSNLPTLNLDLYMYVDNIQDIKDAMNGSKKHENFRLSQDLTLDLTENVYIDLVKGVLDGDGHTITNLNSEKCFIRKLSGTLKNLNVETYQVNTKNTGNYGALICESTSGAIVDNVHLNNVTTTAGASSGDLHIAGMIGSAVSTKVRNSSVSNIKIKNIASMAGRDAYVGGMIAKASSTNITNSFVRKIDFELKSYVPADTYTGQSEILGVKSYVASGGLVGKMENGILENVYTTGTINSKFGKIGGIVGETNGYIRGAISKVNIYSTGTSLGGILGMLSSTDNTNLVSKTLVLGDILSSAETPTEVDRTSGTQITPNQNFAWDKQSMNSIVSSNTKMEELLTEEDLGNPIIYNSKIGLSEYDFAVSVDAYKKKYADLDIKGPLSSENSNLVPDGGVYGVLPKLIHSETGEILNNQDIDEDTEIHYIEMFSLIADPSVTYKQYYGDPNDYQDDKTVKDAWDGQYVNVVLSLNNPTNKDINSITMENMSVLPGSFSRNKIGDGVWQLSFSAKATENQNYDSYKITSINWIDENRDETPYPTAIKLVIPFYGRIETPNQWQRIKPGTQQNFVLANDVSLEEFMESNDTNVGVSFNKLIGLDVLVYDEKGNPVYKTTEDGTIVKDEKGNPVQATRPPVLSHVKKTGLGSGTGLIDTITSEIRNVSFKDIHLEVSSSARGNYFGIIKFLNGSMKGSLDQTTGIYQRMTFEDIYVDGNYVSYSGIVALNKSPDIHYIEYKNVYVRGNSYTGGLIGYSYSYDKTDIIGENIVVYGRGSWVGGLLGYEVYNYNKLFTFHVTLTGINIDGGYGTGGVFGYGGGNYISATGKTDKYLEKTLNSVNGRSTYTGGIVGQYNTGYPYYNYAKHLMIKGVSGTGGIAGYRYNSYNSTVVNCHIEGTTNVGGISGLSGYGAYYCTVAGGSVKGTSNVGGISGRVNWGNVHDCHVGQYGNDITIIEGIDTVDKNGNTVYSFNIGGIVGGNDSNPNSNQRNVVMARITGGYQIGGVVGYIENRLEVSNNKQHRIVDTIVANVSLHATRPTKAYVGGLVGRTEKNFPYNYINENVISVSVKTEEGAAHAGYIIGGSEYVYTYDIKDQQGNVLQTITQDYSTTNGDTMLYQMNADGVTIDSKATGLKLYENSTLNGVAYSSPDVGFVIPETSTKKITLDQLRTWSTYSSIISTSYIGMDSGDTTDVKGLSYFPYAKRAEHASQYPNIVTANLPGTDSVAYTSAATPMYHLLPDFKVYAVDVDKINIEFKNTDEYTNLIVNGRTYRVDQNVFTFYYDFKDDFEVTIADLYNSKTTLVSADEVKNGVTIIGEYYYYLKDGEVITNNEDKIVEEDKDDEKPESNDEGYESEGLPDVSPQNQLNNTDNEEENSVEEDSSSEAVVEESQNSDTSIVAYVTNGLKPLSVGKTTTNKLAASDTEDNTVSVVENATNIYGNEILLDDQSIYNITTGQVYRNEFDNLTLADTESLHEYTYANQRIETFYYYSLVDGKKVDKQVYVKNGQIEIMSPDIDNKKNQILVDNYNDKNYLIYLGGDGKLYSLKDDIEFPKGFKNINIKSISTNAQANTDMMLVEYKDGSYTVFNYRTGQLLQRQSDENISLEDYIKEYLELNFDDLTKGTKNSSYEEAKKLVEKLNTRPVSSFNDSDLDGVLTSKKYSIAYDPATEKYFVYELPGENDSSSNSLTTALGTSVDSIIDADPLMVEYYRGGEGTKVTLLSSILIVMGIILGITGAVLTLGKNVKKEKKISQGRKEAKA